MTDMPTECQKIRRLMRQYLLGTLPPATAARIETHIETCSGCREAIEVERKTLAGLDVLEPLEPTTDLTAAVMDEVRQREERAPLAPVRMPAFAYQLIAVFALVGILAAILLPALSRAREAARRASTANNLKQFGIVFKMYANENNGVYPPLAPYDGVWMVDLRTIYPEYLTDLEVLVDHSRPDRDRLVEDLQRLAAESPVDWEQIHRVAARSLTYFNWSMQGDSDAIALKEAFPRLAKADYDNDISVPGGTLHRFKEGIERFMITDINNPAGSAQAQSEVPTMFAVHYADRRRLTVQGFNVLYMDGHVEFIKYGESFPSTPAVLDTFRPSEN